ncbi:MAG: hypothetical protein H8E66_02895 [Planctomycetes bacterium]|nr:hypothetical protein [Planctomycetota bacterium]
MNWHKQLRQKLANIILDQSVRDCVASFLDRELGDPSTIKLPNRVIDKRKRHGKSATVKKWNGLDLEALVAVVDEQFSNRIQNKPAELKTCLKYMRHVRDYASHIEGDPNIPELITYTSFLHRFLNFIEAPTEVHGVIEELERELLQSRSLELGVSVSPDASVNSNAPDQDKFHTVNNDPFTQVEGLLDRPSNFVGRSEIIERIHEFVNEHELGTLIIEAEPGTGKSAIIARCVRHKFAETTPRPACFVYHQSEGMTDPATCIRTLYDQLVEIHSIDQAAVLEPTDDARRLRTKLERLLADHVSPKLGEGKQLIFIDGLDEADIGKDLTSYQALPSPLPKGIILVATTRHIPARSEVLVRREDVERVNLNSTDFDIANGKDAEEFVTSRLAGKSSDATVQREICRVGGGNFLVLRELCRWVSEKLSPQEVPDFLKRLATETGTESDNLHQLYEEFWRRLPQQKLDTIGEVAGLLLVIRGRATESLCVEALDAGLTKWETAIDAMAEYLRPRQEVNGSTSFGFYHQSFADYLQTKVKVFADQAKNRMAEMCLRWRELIDDVQDYALQHGPEHFCRAKRWHDLRRLLTDFEFIEKKCNRGNVYELVADFDLARRSDPDWLQANENENRRQKTLDNWAADVKESGSRWSAELRRAWQHDGSESVELERSFRFPDPPDTSDLCNLFRGKWDELWDAGSWSESISELESWRTFLTHSAVTLTHHPQALYQCVANSSVGRNLREQAEKVLCDGKTPWLEERPHVEVNAGAIPLPTIPVKATAFAISADGRRAATGEANGKLRLWDLVSGKQLCWELAHREEVSHVCLSVDGSRLVSVCTSGSILAYDCREFRQIWSAETERDIVDISCSPEGSVIAVAGSDGKIRVFDVEGTAGESQCELSNSRLHAIARVRIWPEPFCILGSDRQGHIAVWDLITGATPDCLPPDGRKTRHILKADEPCEDSEAQPIDIGLGQFVVFNVKGRSADGRIAVDESNIYVDGKYLFDVYSDGMPTDLSSCFGDVKLIADGRVVWSRGEDAIRGADLLVYEEMEEFERRPRQRDRGLWEWTEDPIQSIFEMQQEMDQFLSGLDDTDDDKERDLGTSHRPLNTRLVEEPPLNPEHAIVTIDRGDRGAYTSDLRLVIDDNHVDENDCSVLHRIDGPEGERVGLVQVSPCGERAFVSFPSCWFIWDIARGTKNAARPHSNWKHSVVLPDWKCVASMEDEMLVIVDLLTGAKLRQAEFDVDTIGTPREIQVTPDGKSIVIGGTEGVSVVNTLSSKLAAKFALRGLSDPIISPDAKVMVCFREQMVEIYHLATGKKLLSQPCRNNPSPWCSAWMAPDGTINGNDTDATNEWRMTLRNSNELSQLEPIATPTRIFRYHRDAIELRNAIDNKRLTGRPDLYLTAVCGHCGKLLPVSESTETAIDEISTNMSSEKSSCLHLHDEAWTNPRLRIQCDHCGQTLRLNPFVA